MIRKPLRELYSFNKVLCYSCGIDAGLLYNSEVDCYYCSDCLDNEEEELEENEVPSYLELCKERNGDLI